MKTNVMELCEIWGKNGGPAFPVATNTKTEGVTFAGMSLRDWFAGQALAGICAHRNASSNTGTDLANEWNASIVEAAFHIADAMLAARMKVGEP